MSWKRIQEHAVPSCAAFNVMYNTPPPASECLILFLALHIGQFFTAPSLPVSHTLSPQTH